MPSEHTEHAKFNSRFTESGTNADNSKPLSIHDHSIQGQAKQARWGINLVAVFVTTSKVGLWFRSPLLNMITKIRPVSLPDSHQWSHISDRLMLNPLLPSPSAVPLHIMNMISRIMSSNNLWQSVLRDEMYDCKDMCVGIIHVYFCFQDILQWSEIWCHK